VVQVVHLSEVLVHQAQTLVVMRLQTLVAVAVAVAHRVVRAVAVLFM
jgi:hypothetical protein